MQMRWRKRTLPVIDFPSLARCWSSKVSSFPFPFFPFFHPLMFLSLVKSSLEFSANIANDSILDAVYWMRDIETGAFEEGWYVNHDRRHYRWWVAPRDRRNWFREGPIANTRRSIAYRTSRASPRVIGGRYFGGVLDILFNLTWAQM